MNARTRSALSLAVVPLAVGVCTLVKLAIPAIAPVHSFILYFFGIAASAWVARSLGGALATVLSCVAVGWMEWRATGTLGASTLIPMALFTLEGSGVTLLIHLLRAQAGRLAALDATAEASRHLLTNIIETAPSAIVGVEADDTLFLFNRAAEQMTGFRREEVLGKSLEVFVPEEQRPAVVTGFHHVTPAPLSEPYRSPWWTRSGERRLIEWRRAGLPTGNRVIGIGVDVTDLKALEDERVALVASERSARQKAENSAHSKDRFLATISHELRGPLTAILGWAQLLVAARADEATLIQGLTAIEENARAQARLVEDLLDYTRIAAGHIELERCPVRVADLVRSAVDAFTPEAQRKQLEIRTAVASADLLVEGDPRRLRQVFMNVLQNAVRYTDRGHIDVQSEQAGELVRIRIRDTGRGIAPEFLPQIFDRFSQEFAGGSSRSGLGLGLAIVKELVTLHGGTVRAESEGPGKGAAFSIELPVAS